MVAIALVHSDESLTDRRVIDCFNFVVEHEEQVRDYFTEHAYRSKTLGYNSSGWVRVAEACAKTYALHMNDSSVMNDNFILGLALKLSKHYSQMIAH